MEIRILTDVATLNQMLSCLWIVTTNRWDEHQFQLLISPKKEKPSFYLKGLGGEVMVEDRF